MRDLWLHFRHMLAVIHFLSRTGVIAKRYLYLGGKKVWVK